MQYTIRNVPKHVDQALRHKAKQANRSLNEVLLSAIEQGLNLAPEQKVYHDLDWFFGSGAGLDREAENWLTELDRVSMEDVKRQWAEIDKLEKQEAEKHRAG